jgi:hypothetical protein
MLIYLYFQPWEKHRLWSKTDMSLNSQFHHLIAETVGKINFLSLSFFIKNMNINTDFTLWWFIK